MKVNVRTDIDVKKIRKKHCVQLKLDREFFLLSFQTFNLPEKQADYFKPECESSEQCLLQSPVCSFCSACACTDEVCKVF